MRLSTFLKILAAIVGGLVLVFGLYALAAYNALREPPFDPPEVAPLGDGATFQADRVAETASGFLVAGVVGTTDPLRGVPCSGRLGLLFLNARGRPIRAVLLPGLEESRYCAERVDALLRSTDGGWVIAATGIRDGGESGPPFGGRSTDSLPVTLRVDASGAPVDAFGDGGIIEDHSAAGRVDGVVFTTKLNRMSENGAVRDDMVDGKEWWESWRSFEVEDDVIVAIEVGLGRFTFQTFERVDPSTFVYRPLHPASVTGVPTIELGSIRRIEDTQLHGGVMYVAVRDEAGARVNAVDPRTLEVLFEFGGRGTGAVRLPGHVWSAELMSDTEDRLVVALTAVDRGHPGDRLHVLRYSAGGILDDGFGGKVKRNGRDVLMKHGVEDALVDATGRVVAVGGETTLVKLTTSGRLDSAFGNGGVVDLRRFEICSLAPASITAACRGT